MSEATLHIELDQARDSIQALREELERTNSEVLQLTLDLEDKINQLQRSENKYRELAESLTDPFTAWDANLRCIYRNKAADLAIQVPNNEAINKTFEELYPGQVGTDIHRACLQTLEDHQSRTLQVEWLRPVDGRRFYYEVSLYPTQEGLTVFSRDITDEKKAARELEASEARYRGLFNGMTEGFGLHEIICDAQGKPVDYRFLEINPAFEQMTGLKAEIILGRRVREVLPAVESAWIETYGKVALTGQAVRFQNYSYDLGKYYEVVAYCPEPGKFATLFFDVSEQKRLEAEAQARNTQVEVQRRLLEQREQERMQIARDLHDGPVQELTGAYYALDGILYSGEDEGLAQGLRGIRETLRNQVAELRNYAGELRPPALAKFGLARGIRAHLELFREKHPELSVQYEEDVQETDLFSEQKRLAVYRIYQEAMNNIVKHSNASEIAIHLLKNDQGIRLEIRDNGQGFEVPDDWLDLIRQGHLGLAGMKERAEAAGGHLEIESHRGNSNQGTTTKVEIPA